MLWAALLPDNLPCDESRRTEATSGLATWCLQFTPRVAVIEALSASPAVVMEVEASARLFGGKRRLVERVREESPDLGVRQLSWAPTSLAAVAIARAGRSNGFAKPVDQLLDALPLETLTAVAAHQATLARLGCQTLGQVRALPRGGLSRRFDSELLAALDQAYGLRPEAHTWIELAETFSAKLELMARVELAPALLFGARRLMLQMSGWLAARHCGVNAFTLRWCHDAMRSRAAGEGGEMTVRTAQPTRDIEHLTRLLAEHLAKIQLLAPVGDLELLAVEVHSLEEKSHSLFPEPQQAGESLALVLERIAARLGPQRVLRPVVMEDHRIEWMSHWQPAPEPRPRKLNRCRRHSATDLRAARAAQAGDTGRTAALPRAVAAAGRSAPRRRRLVGPHDRGRRSREHATSRATTGSHSVSTPACSGSSRRVWQTKRPPGSCTVCSPERSPWLRYPTTPNCVASATSASCAARASPRNWSNAPSNWATPRWRSPTSVR